MDDFYSCTRSFSCLELTNSFRIMIFSFSVLTFANQKIESSKKELLS